jgi:glycerol dehydrogenase
MTNKAPVSASQYPGKYIQGQGQINYVQDYAAKLGNNAFIVYAPSSKERVENIIVKKFKKANLNCKAEKFNRESSKKEIDRLVEICKENKCNLVIGIGGGKCLDTAKAVSYYMEIPVISIPTTAATDAPCSALSVIYTETGEMESYLPLRKNPDVIIIDSAIVTEAPVRLLVAGMGDALATKFEARANLRSHSICLSGSTPSITAMALASLCYDTLLSDGKKAKISVENKVVTNSVERIIEANTLLSGVGFESGGIAASHAVHDGLTVLEETHHYYHGEKVSFGVITQLVLENADNDEIKEVIAFCKDVGLPTTLADLGITEVTKEKLMMVAEAACAEGSTVHNMPFEVTPESLYGAMIVADKLGGSY